MEWTEQDCLDAIQAHYEQNGEPPKCLDWEEPDPWNTRPTTRTVKKKFGAWNSAISRCGLSPRKPGGRKGLPSHEVETIVSYANAHPELNYTELARDLGYSDKTVKKYAKGA